MVSYNIMHIPNTVRVILLLVCTTIVACLVFPQVWSFLSPYSWMDYPPARVFRRVWMISVLLGLILWRKSIGLQHPAKVGFTLNGRSFINVLVGLCVVVFFLLLLTSVYLTFDLWEYHFRSNRFTKMVWVGFLRGFLVAGIEEYIFRGLLFVSLARRWGWIHSAIFTSLIFSSLHFLEGYGIQDNIQDPSNWSAGFIICGQMLHNMASQFTFFPDAFGLFLVGFIMCYGVHRTGSLWYSAGLHGGWIWFSAFIKYIWIPTGILGEFYIGGTRLFNGVIPILGMLIIFPITYFLVHKSILQTSHSPHTYTKLRLPPT